MDMLARDVPPLPAGGCAAALCGAAAASLGMMMTKILIRRSTIVSDKAMLQHILEDLLILQNTCLHLMDEDQAAYEKVIDVMRQLKLSGMTVAEKEVSLQEAYLISLKPPMDLIEASVRMLRLFQNLAANIHEPLKADMIVAVESACACFKGSFMIAGENLKKIRNPETVLSIMKQLNMYQLEFKTIMIFFGKSKE